jgi:hypothetical protein
LRLAGWFRDQLPVANRAVLSGAAAPGSVAEAIEPVLPDLPSPGALNARTAQQLVIGLGLVGSSVARHFQESDPRRKANPEHAFDGLLAGPDQLPFPAYFAALAEQTGTGHYERDAYASLVLWNVPTTDLRVDGDVLTTLPGLTEGPILSYTGDPAEEWFFEFVKRGQTLEAGVNALLEPIADGEVGMTTPDGLQRARLATTLLRALRQLFLDGSEIGDGAGMEPEFFMDVFRQFAAHWFVGDIPPSGALDVDAIKRDFLLGTVDEPYARHAERMMPALLRDERGDLRHRMDQQSLPARLLTNLDLGHVALSGLPSDRLAALVTAHPALATWYQVLAGHARAAGAHLRLSKRFLFTPQRWRDGAGLGDRSLVSNRRGTTGMDESHLERLARMRRSHRLADLRQTPDDAWRSVAPTPGWEDVVVETGGSPGRSWSAEDGVLRPRDGDPGYVSSGPPRRPAG